MHTTILDHVKQGQTMTVENIVSLLTFPEVDSLYQAANECRHNNMGDDIYLRGIIEFSNICIKNCNYCGIRGSNTEIVPYRIPDKDILNTCQKMVDWGYTSVVLQSGEDPFYTTEKLAKLIMVIKETTPLAITLSVGERDEEAYRIWKKAGMDRYLLRFETSDPKLFKACHPDDDLFVRLECLETLRNKGIQVGSGFLIGLPNETLEQLAHDILFCTQLNLDMIGIGPFIAHPNTPFADQPNSFNSDIFYKTIAILRLLNPLAHIPATTAFDAIDPNGRDLVLQRGANVFMPNATPMAYREHYQLYPGKPCITESSDDCAGCVKGRIKRLGRTLGNDAGHSFKNPLR